MGENGKCECNIEDGQFEYMTKDRYGSCTCENGYWLTEFGCKKCSELIPGCDECYKTSMNTMIPLYSGAEVGYSSRTYYLDCRKCGYHNYRVRANFYQ